LRSIIRYDRNSSEKRFIGYARVSTYGQTIDSQLEQLRPAGCGSRNIYREKVTGARPDRRERLRMLDQLVPGDVVTVTRIDRLARSTFDLFGIVKRVVDGKAQFRSLAEPWADTGTSAGRLMLAVLGGLADVERDLIRTRTAEGRNRAKAQGSSSIGRRNGPCNIPVARPAQAALPAHRRGAGDGGRLPTEPDAPHGTFRGPQPAQAAAPHPAQCARPPQPLRRHGGDRGRRRPAGPRPSIASSMLLT
jgi:DNA invertase Pin-like site-specific DNA recombinase